MSQASESTTIDAMASQPASSVSRPFRRTSVEAIDGRWQLFQMQASQTAIAVN